MNEHDDFRWALLLLPIYWFKWRCHANDAQALYRVIITVRRVCVCVSNSETTDSIALTRPSSLKRDQSINVSFAKYSSVFSCLSLLFVVTLSSQLTFSVLLHQHFKGIKSSVCVNVHVSAAYSATRQTKNFIILFFRSTFILLGITLPYLTGKACYCLALRPPVGPMHIPT